MFRPTCLASFPSWTSRYSRVRTLPPSLTAAAIVLEDCANTFILRCREGGVDRYAALVSLGSKRLDVNGAGAQHLGAQRLTFAKREQTTDLTAWSFGVSRRLACPITMQL